MKFICYTRIQYECSLLDVVFMTIIVQSYIGLYVCMYTPRNNIGLHLYKCLYVFVFVFSDLLQIPYTESQWVIMAFKYHLYCTQHFIIGYDLFGFVSLIVL